MPKEAIHSNLAPLFLASLPPCSARGRLLFVAFTVRRNLIRVISVRDMNRREKETYGKH